MSQVRDAGRPDPPRLAGQPVVIDTDIGGDPDDAVAFAVAALCVPDLALVLTADEHDGQRARFARHFLDLLGRPDVPVVSGRDLGNDRYLAIDGLTPADVPAQPDDVIAAVTATAEATGGPIRWVGLAPMSNLADLLTTRPPLTDQMHVTQMGGALNYRDPSRAEHNVRLDVAAAKAAIAGAARPRLVISDVTFTPDIEITPGSPVHRHLDAAEPGTWQALLGDHLDQWFAGFHPGTMQHDPLTLSAALDLPFLDFELEHIALDDIGRMHKDPDGIEVFLAHNPDYPAFWRWLLTCLDTPTPAAHTVEPARPR